MKLRKMILASAALIALVSCREQCTAVVEHMATLLQKDRFRTEFAVSHDAGPEVVVWVFFEYWIRYESPDGRILVERGVFRELVPGRGATFFKEDIALHEPARIVSVEIDPGRCRMSQNPDAAGIHGFLSVSSSELALRSVSTAGAGHPPTHP